MLPEVQDLRGLAVADARPTKATLIGLLIGTGLAIVAAMGPLVSAITITVGVETQVGDASGLPDARMLPAALEGVGAVALIFLLTRRPTGGVREVVRCHVWVGRTKGAMIDGGSTFRRPCSALLAG
jgi:hypothetical protein